MSFGAWLPCIVNFFKSPHILPLLYLVKLFSLKPQTIGTKIYLLCWLLIFSFPFGFFQTHTPTIFTAVLFNVHVMPIICFHFSCLTQDVCISSPLNENHVTDNFFFLLLLCSCSDFSLSVKYFWRNINYFYVKFNIGKTRIIFSLYFRL